MGVSCDAEDAGCLVELVEAVKIEQGVPDLAGRGFCSIIGSGKVKAAPARGPSTRLRRPSSPMAMPTTCERRMIFNDLEDREIVGEGAR